MRFFAPEKQRGIRIWRSSASMDRRAIPRHRIPSVESPRQESLLSQVPPHRKAEKYSARQSAADLCAVPPTLPLTRSTDSWCCTPGRKSYGRYESPGHPIPPKPPKSLRYKPWHRRNLDETPASAYGIAARAVDSLTTG